MKKLLVTALLTATVAGGTAQVKNQSHGYPIDPVPFTSVKVTDSFWGQRLNASREVTIPLAFSKCEETGRYTNFVNAAHPSDTIKVGGLAFDDTDVYKTIERCQLSVTDLSGQKNWLSILIVCWLLSLRHRNRMVISILRVP